MWLAMRAGTTSTRATWLESLLAAQRRNPNSPQLAAQLADQHLSMYQRFGIGEDLERAAEALTRAIELSGSEEQHVAQRALVLRELGQPQRAAEDWQRAEELSQAGGHAERDLGLVQVLAVETIGEAVMRTGPRRLSARAAWQVPGR
jgi:tetratricopeptide (TPR) repeat protein